MFFQVMINLSKFKTKISFLLMLGLMVSCQTVQITSNNPQINTKLMTDNIILRFLRQEILFGSAKYQLKPDTRNIGNNKAINLYDQNDIKALSITMDKQFEGHRDDWLRIGEQNQRWELANKDNPIYLSKKPIYIKYNFKITEHDTKDTGGTFFQIIANNNKSRILPWLKLKYYGDQVQLDLNLVKEVFWLTGDPENTNFDKKSYRFKLGHFKDFTDFRTLKLKILPSENNNGEIIAWIDDKRIFELYGPNFTIGNAYSFKLGYYRWLDYKENVETGHLIIKSFGYHKNCKLVLTGSECEYLSKTRESRASVPNKVSYWRSHEHGKKITKTIRYKKKIPNFYIIN